MMSISLEELEQQIQDFVGSNQNPTQIIIGYKTYVQFLREDHFLTHISKHPEDQHCSFYKGILIKMIPEKHYLQVT